MGSPKGSYILRKDNKGLLVQIYEIKVFGDKFFFQTTLSSTALSPVEQTKTAAVVNNAQKTLNIVFQAELSGQAGISLYSIDGKCLLNRQFSTIEGISTAELSIASLPSGIYLLTISQKNKKETVKIKI
jgi:hypothetical protein